MVIRANKKKIVEYLSKVAREITVHRRVKCQVNPTASWVWKSLASVRDEVGRGIWRKIGDGNSTNIWEDQWIPNTTEGKPTTPKPQSCNLHKVKELITNFRWNRPLIFSTFNGKMLKKSSKFQ